MPDLLARFNILRKNDVIIVEFTESKLLDEMKITQVRDGLIDLVKNEKHPLLLLDFANVDYFSSAALGMLVAVDVHIRKTNGHMRLINVRPQIMKIFALTNLDRVLKFSATLDGAMAIFTRVLRGEAV